MAKMSTTTKILIVAAVGTGVYFVARSVKAKKKVEEKKKLTTGEVPVNGKPNGKGKKPPAGIPKAPPYPAASAADEGAWVAEVYADWRVDFTEQDAQAINSGEVSFDEVISDLTDAAFVMAYPEWVGPEGPTQFPDNWQQSTEWTKWADAWNRMHTQVVDLVQGAMSEYGV